MPVYQIKDKQIAKTENRYFEKVVSEDIVLTQERAVEVPQLQTVELTTQVPKPIWEFIEKPVPKVTIEALELQQEVQVTTRQEQPIEVPVPEVHELKVQVAKVQHMPREV